MSNIVLILISVVLGVAGQIGLKYGALSAQAAGGGLLAFINWPVAGGLAFYGVSTMVWLAALRTAELSFAYPLLSLGYVLVVIASYFLFHETVNMTRIAGVALILAGIFLVSRS